MSTNDFINSDLLTLYEGDCAKELKKIPDNSVDLIFTSPPYAEQRKKQYESIHVEEYSGWFIKIAYELYRILKPTGSFFLNLKPHCEKGERSLYVYDLVSDLRRIVNFCFIDEIVWYKSANPRRKSHRLKDAWEPIFHFTKNVQNIYINHKVIQVRSDSTFGSKRGSVSLDSVTGNMGGYHEICVQRRGYTDPDNILYFPTALMVKDKFKHPAKFPLELAAFFIKGYCPVGGTVCDPFVGSGIAALASLVLHHKCLAIEKDAKYCEMTRNRINEYIPPRRARKIKMKDYFPLPNEEPPSHL